MKTEKELMKMCFARDDWKTLKLWSWAYDFEAKANEWNNIMPPVLDDRRLFIHNYGIVYKAIESLPDNPNSWICCAVQRELSLERAKMNRIIERFSHKGGQNNA